jgi:hypothetical protein
MLLQKQQSLLMLGYAIRPEDRQRSSTQPTISFNQVFIHK